VVEIHLPLVASITSGDTIDYRYSRVADQDYANSISVLKVLHDIRDSVLGSPFNPVNVTVILSENSITTVGFKQLVDFFITDKQQIASRIKHIDLSNNRIDQHAKGDVLELLRRYTSLTLDLSINYLSAVELITDMEENVRSRIAVRAF
jgi:hypothetical protein